MGMQAGAVKKGNEGTNEKTEELSWENVENFMEQHYKVELNYIKYIFGEDNTLTQNQIDYLKDELGKENFEKLKELRKKFEGLDPVTKEKMMRDLGILIMWYGLPSFVKSDLPEYLDVFVPVLIKDMYIRSSSDQSPKITTSKEEVAMAMHDIGIEALGFKNSNWQEKLFENIKKKGYWIVPKPTNMKNKASGGNTSKKTKSNNENSSININFSYFEKIKDIMDEIDSQSDKKSEEYVGKLINRKERLYFFMNLYNNPPEEIKNALKNLSPQEKERFKFIFVWRTYRKAVDELIELKSSGKYPSNTKHKDYISFSLTKNLLWLLMESDYLLNKNDKIKTRGDFLNYYDKDEKDSKLLSNVLVRSGLIMPTHKGIITIYLRTKNDEIIKEKIKKDNQENKRSK